VYASAMEKGFILAQSEHWSCVLDMQVEWGMGDCLPWRTREKTSRRSARYGTRPIGSNAVWGVVRGRATRKGVGRLSSGDRLTADQLVGGVKAPQGDDL